jgi:hypothetical protein
LSYNKDLKLKLNYYKEEVTIIFINAIKSPATRSVYNTSLKRYLNHLKTTNPDDLLLDTKNTIRIHM